jgi:phage baseplate assembly protein V
MSEHVYDARAMIREATVVNVNDGGGFQTVDVVTHEGGVFSGIPVIQAWGFASRPPLTGLRAILLCVGGDPANMRALLYNVTRRLGGLATGETAVYANNGARVALRQGGTIQMQAGAVVEIGAPSVTVAATGSISLDGSIVVTGTVSVAGDIDMTGNIHATGSIGH